MTFPTSPTNDADTPEPSTVPSSEADTAAGVDLTHRPGEPADEAQTTPGAAGPAAPADGTDSSNDRPIWPDRADEADPVEVSVASRPGDQTDPAVLAETTEAAETEAAETEAAETEAAETEAAETEAAETEAAEQIHPVGQGGSAGQANGVARYGLVQSHEAAERAEGAETAEQAGQVSISEPVRSGGSPAIADATASAPDTDGDGAGGNDDRATAPAAPDDHDAGAEFPGVRPAVEAILLVADEPVSEVTLAQVLERPRDEVLATLHDLSAEFVGQGRGFELRQVAGGWRLYTRPECASVVERFVLDGQQARLTQAALETLAVVAYRQPVSRSRVSAVRGVNVDGVMRTLVARGLVEEAGTDRETGAILYRTTSYFLERLGINSLDDLPDLAPLLPEVATIDSSSYQPQLEI